nr:trpA [Erythrotrichia longistipitata]
MPKSISETFQLLKSNGECALVPFITAGDPSLDVTERVIETLDSEGASIIELGLPYSDSLADGPIIQAAAARALDNDINFVDILSKLGTISSKTSAPIVIFTYYNLVLRQGVENFVLKIASSGAKGLLVPDLPLEESKELLEICSNNGLELILLIAPTSSPERIQMIVEKAQGCLYIVAANGVTGLKTNFDIEIRNLIHYVKQMTSKPIIVGFGISNASQAALIKSWGVDGVVLGSAFVRQLASYSEQEGLSGIRSFCKEIKESLK